MTRVSTGSSSVNGSSAPQVPDSAAAVLIPGSIQQTHVSDEATSLIADSSQRSDVSCDVNTRLIEFLSNPFPDGFDRASWSSRVDWFKEFYSVVGAGLVDYSCFTKGGMNASLGLIATLLLTFVWDGSNVASAALSSPVYFQRYKDDPTWCNFFLAWGNLVTNMALAVAVIVSTVSSLQAAYREGFSKVVLESDNTLGGTPQLMSADFGFGLSALFDMFVRALNKDTAANIAGDLTCGVGAFLGALSMVREKGYVIASGCSFSISAILKISNLWKESDPCRMHVIPPQDLTFSVV